VKIPVTQTAWYAPGIDLVHFERHEPVDFEAYFGDSMVFELVAFEH
jgi:hypothetical protein